MSNFIEDCLSGHTTLSEINNYIDQWHEANTEMPIHAFLGMTSKEYVLFVKDEKNLESIVIAHKESKDIEHVLQDKQQDYKKSNRN